MYFLMLAKFDVNCEASWSLVHGTITQDISAASCTLAANDLLVAAHCRNRSFVYLWLTVHELG